MITYIIACGSLLSYHTLLEQQVHTNEDDSEMCRVAFSP